MSNPTMLYKHPGPHSIHDDKFDYVIVDADEPGALEAAAEAGWSRTTDEAKARACEAGAAAPAASAEPAPAADDPRSRTRKPKA